MCDIEPTVDSNMLPPRSPPICSGACDADGLGDHGVEIDVRRRRIVAGELLVQLGHPHLADTVGHHVVQDRPDRRLAAPQPVDHHVAPQRTGAVERFLVQLGRQIEQLAFGARLGQTQESHVVVEIELGVGRPDRSGEPADARHDTFEQARHARPRPLASSA